MRKLKYLFEKINASFWFVPMLMLSVTIGLAIGLIYLDSRIHISHDGALGYLLPDDVDSARNILTIIAGAMIGVAGTVFSITLVVLTLASTQLGSRLVRNFMYDRLNQIALGTYVSSFVYCLIILGSLRENDGFRSVPAISLFIAFTSAIAGIILLVVYIHHVSMSIQADKVISDIYGSMSKSIRKLYPGEIGREEDKPVPDIGSLQQKYIFKLEVRCKISGYLQSIYGEGLMSIAEKNDCVIILNHRPGDFIVLDMTLCEVYCNKECNKAVHEKIHDEFLIGRERTPLQDAEFSVEQMVQGAARALFVNDPFTAIACIDYLTSVMCYLARADFPSPYRYDSQGQLRIIARNFNFSGMMNAAFNQIRQYAEGSPSVLIRLMETMKIIYSFATNKNQQEQIEQHAEMLMNTAERIFSEKRDLENMKERYKAFNN